MITRDDLKERAHDFKGEKKCAMYFEVSDANNGQAWAFGTGDPSVQIRAIAQYLIQLSETLEKNNNIKVSPYQMAKDIVKLVDTEPRIEGHITKVEVKEGK